MSQVIPARHIQARKFGHNIILNLFISGFAKLSPDNNEDLSMKSGSPETPDIAETFLVYSRKKI